MVLFHLMQWLPHLPQKLLSTGIISGEYTVAESGPLQPHIYILYHRAVAWSVFTQDCFLPSLLLYTSKCCKCEKLDVWWHFKLRWASFLSRSG